jgi:hypothetical protein
LKAFVGAEIIVISGELNFFRHGSPRIWIFPQQ